MSKKRIIGIAVFNGPNVFGKITLTELDDLGTKVRIKADLNFAGAGAGDGAGARAGKLAWHIHEAGDLRGHDCAGACAHFNPRGVNHGGPRDKVKHVGDLGNLRVREDGTSVSSLTVDFVRLRGKNSVIGRSLVIHEGEDDLGRGGDEESLRTGNAGARIGCAVIGYSAKSRLYF